MHEVKTLAHLVKIDETVYQDQVQKVVKKLKLELKQQQRIIRGYLKFKNTAGYLKPRNSNCCFNFNADP